jgi:hypothetical protein
LHYYNARQRPVDPYLSKSQKGRLSQGPRSLDQAKVKKEVAQTSTGRTASPLDGPSDEFSLFEDTDSVGNTKDAQANYSVTDLEEAKTETGNILAQRRYALAFNRTRDAWRAETTAPFPTNIQKLSPSLSFI